MEKIVLKNGLRILFEEIEWVKTCSMGVWVGSGSRWEKPETAGVSHFIEHILFKGTKTKSAFDIAMKMDEIGGALNAYTTKEYTCFYVRSLSEHTGIAFDIIADMLTNPKMDGGDIETERGVILEELAMYEDSPEDLCSDLLYESIWRDDMLGRNIVGTRESIAALKEKQLREHMASYYTPERTVISFCGKFERERMLEMCEKYFGEAKPGGSPIEFSSPAFCKGVSTLHKPFEQNQLVLALPGIPSLDEERFAAALVCTILGGSTSSRLFQRLREELGLVYSVDAFNTPYLGAGVVGVALALSKKSEKTALRETLEIIRSFSESITEQELSRVKEQSVSSFIMGLESTSARASRMAVGELLFNKVTDEDELIKKVRSISVEDSVRTAKKLLNTDSLAVCAVGKVHDKEFYEKL